MAKVRNPLLSSDASGSFGDTIYARNQFGAYAYPKPVLPPSASTFQTDWRTSMTALWNKWAYTSTAQATIRAAYENFARSWPITDRFGTTQYLSGFDWYFKLNCWYFFVTGYSHDTPPLNPNCSFNPTVSYYQQSNGIWLHIIDSMPGSAGAVFGKVPEQNCTRYFCPNQFLSDTYTGFKMINYNLIYPNADVKFALKRYFLKYYFIDPSGRPSTTLYTYIDARKMNLPGAADCLGDNFINEGNPNSNYGSSTVLRNAIAAGDVCRDVLTFDLSDFESDWIAQEVLLYAYCSSKTTNGYLDAHQMLVTWSELQSTWNEASTGVNWSSAGMASGTDYAAAVLDSTLVDTASAWFTWDITALFNAWVAGTKTNYGVCLIPITDPCEMLFQSRDSATPSLRPYLDITWREI